MKCLGRRGVGLVEILIALACFIMALIPIMNLMSTNIENTTIIQARSFSFTACREILSQLRLVPVSSLTTGIFPLDDLSGNSSFGKGGKTVNLFLSKIPPEFKRSVTIESPSPGKFEIRVMVRSNLHPMADLELSGTVTDAAVFPAQK